MHEVWTTCHYILAIVGGGVCQITLKSIIIPQVDTNTNSWFSQLSPPWKLCSNDFFVHTLSKNKTYISLCATSLGHISSGCMIKNKTLRYKNNIGCMKSEVCKKCSQ